MDIMTILFIWALMGEIPQPPVDARAARRAERDKSIRRNRALYHSRLGHGHWTETRRKDGCFHSYHDGQVVSRDQDGRWDDYHFGGHRRFARWSKEAYPSLADVKATARWEAKLKDYFEE